MVQRGDKVNPEWRCPFLKKMSFEGEWRRCSFTARKEKAIIHTKREFDFARANDPMFPIDFRGDAEKLTLERTGKKILRLIAKMAVETGMSARRASGEAMHSFVVGILQL